MFDEPSFRKILRISAVLCFAIAILTVALRFSSGGASCPALVGAPLPVFVSAILGWKSISWRRNLDQIIATKARLDDMGLQSTFLENVNYNILLGIVMAGFVGFSSVPLILYFTQCP